MYRFNHKNIFAGAGRIFLICLLMLASFSLQAQMENSLTGRVVDENGQPITGAVVNVAEESRITLTDKEGYFTLTGLGLDDELNISAVGYKDLAVTVEFVESFKVVMQEDLDLYEATIATPFGRTQRKFVVNSMSTVTGSELEKHPITVLQNAFTSTVTGVETYEISSEPGWSETELYIRGLRTMNSSARAPLIIVDNVERDLSFLDAYPIETISILKDAAATAIYGMRGANGVVLVTTKRGVAGKTKIDFTQEFGFQAIAGIPRLQNSYNYALTMNQARYLDGLQPAYTDEDIEYYRQASDETLDPSLRYKYINTDWYDVMLRDLAPQMKTNFQISGGNQTARYYVSFTYLRQEGQYNSKWTNWNDGYSTQHVLNRYNLRSNIDIDVTSFLNVSLDLGGRIDNISQPLTSTWTLFTWGTGENLPINGIFAPNGAFALPNDNEDKNAAALLAQTGIDYNRRRNLYSNMTATGNLDFITPGLKVKAIIGFDAYNTFQSTQSQNFDGYYFDPDSGVADDPDSYTYIRKRTATSLGNQTAVPRDMNYNVNVIGSLNYARTFGKHAVDAQVMMRSYRNVVIGMSSSLRYMTYGGIFNYIYDNRYVAQVQASYMGHDNYAPGERYGFFPGLSLGWVLSEESWMKNRNINLLKLRASIGRSGQSTTGVNRYPYQGEFSYGSGYAFGTSQTVYPSVYESASGNRNIKWELSDMMNIGLDFDIFNRKLYGQIDVFKEWRSNILVSRSTVPDMYGANVPQDSYGKAETRGFEATLGHQGKIGDFKYYIEGMLSFNRSKMTEIDEVEKDYDYQRLTGLAIGYHNGISNDNHLRFERVQWASDESLIATSHQDAINNPEKYPYHAGLKLGNAVYYDANGDRMIDAFDKVPYKYNRIPELVPSLNVGFEFKGFDARVILTAYLNRLVECRENMDYGFGWGGASTHEVTKTWGYYTDDPTDPRNINALYPRLSTTFSDIDRNYPYNTSSVWLRNGNFLSLRNVEVGYSLPKHVIAKAHMTNVRVYFSGYNLYNWSNFDNGFDPENPTNYLWAYPKTKSFSVGVKIGF